MYLRRRSDDLDDLSGGGITPPQQQHDEAAAAAKRPREDREETKPDPDHKPYQSPEPKLNRRDLSQEKSASFDPKNSTGMFDEDKDDKKKAKDKKSTKSDGQKPTAAEGKEIDLFTGGKNNRHKFGKGKLKSKAQKKIIAGIVAMIIGGGGAALTGGGFLATFRLFIFDGALHEALDAPHQNALIKRSFRNSKPMFDQTGEFTGRTDAVQNSTYGKALQQVKINNIEADMAKAGVVPNFDPSNRTLLGFTNSKGELISAVDDYSAFGRRRAIKEAMKEVYPRGRLRRSYASRLAYKRYGGQSRFLLVEKALGKTEKDLDKASERLTRNIRKRVLKGDTDPSVKASSSGGENTAADEDGTIDDGNGTRVEADADEIEVSNGSRTELGSLGDEVNDLDDALIKDPKLKKPNFRLSSIADLQDAFKNAAKSKASFIARNPVSIAQYLATACTLRNYLNIITHDSRDIKEESATRVDNAFSSGAQQAAADPDGPSGEEIDALNNNITSTKEPGEEMQSSELVQSVVLAGTGSPVAASSAAGLYGFVVNPPPAFAKLQSILGIIPEGMCKVATDVKFQIGATALELGLMFIPGGQFSQAFKEGFKAAFIKAIEDFSLGAVVKSVGGTVLKGGGGALGVHILGEVLKKYAVNSLAGVNADGTESPNESATGWTVGRLAGTNATARQIGAGEMDIEKATSFNQEAIEAHRIDLAMMPWYQRYFSIKHSSSLTSLAAINSPSTVQSGLKTGVQYAMRTANPSFAFRKDSTFMKYAGRIIKSGSVYASSSEVAAKKAKSIKYALGINQYGWTEADMNRFPDADENAQAIYGSPENTKAFEEFSKKCFDSVASADYESEECRRQDDMAWRFRTLRLDISSMETSAEASNNEYLGKKLGEFSGGASGGGDSGSGATSRGDSGKCAEGTTDIGQQEFWENGNSVPGVSCQIPGFPSAGTEDVASRNSLVTVSAASSQQWIDLFNAAKADGFALTANSSFRTKEYQVVLFDKAGGDTSRVARPGFSNHQGGHAIDVGGMCSSVDSCPRDSRGGQYDKSMNCDKTRFVRSIDTSSEVWMWMEANAKKFGITQYCNEAWHWETKVYDENAGS